VLEDASTQTVNAWATNVSAGSADESSQAVTFDVVTDDPSLFAVQPALTPSGNLTYKPAPDAYGVATLTVTARDDGGTANGGADASAPRTFTITINQVNDAPSFSAGADQSVLEDSGAQTVNVWATSISTGPANESAQSATFFASVDDPSLFSAQPAVTPSGKLTYTPAADAPEQIFTITIGPVNDAPSFSAGSDQTVISLLGNVTVPGWASNILEGPADEASQSVSFNVTNNNPGLFATQPAVAPDGTLTFQTTLLALGAATVTVRAVDTGGTANGGVDTSPPQTFTITII
jgi:hypothetical protein